MKQYLINHVASFRREERGAVAMTFSLSFIPVISLVAAAVVYGSAVNSKAIAQAATDATALAVASQLNSTTTAEQAGVIATKYLAAMSSPNVRPTLVGNPTLDTSNSGVCITTATTVDSALLRVLPSASLTVKTTSCVATPDNGAFEVALVMDNTGSMGNSDRSGVTKLASAKTAAKSLINILIPNSGTAKASISVVPFTTAVNVGTGYSGASWMDTAGLSSTHWQNYTRPSGVAWLPTSRFDLYTQMGVSWSGCVEERPDPYMITDTAATSALADTKFVPYLWPDEGDQSGNGSVQLPDPSGGSYGGRRTAGSYGINTWDGWSNAPNNNYLYDFGGSCNATAADGYANADATDSISQGSGATKLCKYKGATASSSTGPNKGCPSTPLLPLTTNKTTLNNKIDAMVDGGSTNLLPGFMWAWRTISPNGPFTGVTEATPGPKNPKSYSAAGNTKVIVFMTDGMNTWSSNSSYAYKSDYNALGYYKNNRLSSYGGTTYPVPDGTTASSGNTTSSNYRDQMDASVLAACTNAKAAGIVIYTVGFNISTDPIDSAGLDLLQKCATDSSKFFNATDGASFLAAFNTIGVGINKLRIKS